MARLTELRNTFDRFKRSMDSPGIDLIHDSVYGYRIEYIDGRLPYGPRHSTASQLIDLMEFSILTVKLMRE
jgi:hypothetical protein